MPSPTRTPRVRSKKTAPSAVPRRSRPGNQHARDRARSWRARRVQVPTQNSSADSDEAVLAAASPPPIPPPSSDDYSSLTARMTSERANNIVNNISFQGGSVKPRLAATITALCALAAVAMLFLSTALWLNTTSTGCFNAASTTWARTVLQNKTFYVESKVDTPSAYTWARCAMHHTELTTVTNQQHLPTPCPRNEHARASTRPSQLLLAAGIDTRLH